MRRWVLAVVLLTQVACATINRGPAQRVFVTSDPIGATVNVEECGPWAPESVVTPATVFVSRRATRCRFVVANDEVRLSRHFSMRNYSQALVDLCGDNIENCNSFDDLLMTSVLGAFFFVPSFLVDSASGAIFEQEPRDVLLRAPKATRHIIYLHGRIVQEEASARPKHPEHGYYEYEAIVEELRKRGFEVTAEIRPRGTSVGDGANRAVEQIRALRAAGVPSDRITVVGASMGAAIAIRAAARLGDPDVRFALLSPCLSRTIPAVTQEEGKEPVGRFLAIREESDVPSSECPGDARELVIETGFKHGFLYRPLPEWVDPVIDFASK